MKLLLRTLQAIAQRPDAAEDRHRTSLRELEERLREELDYVNEARNIGEFARLLRRRSRKSMIPAVIKELSSRRVLTMTYLEGYPLTDVFAPAVDPELVAGWRANTTPRVAPNPGVRRAAYRSASRQLSGHLSSAAGHSRFRIDSPLPRADAQGNLKLARAIIAGDDHAMAAAMVRSWAISIGRRTRRRWSRSSGYPVRAGAGRSGFDPDELRPSARRPRSARSRSSTSSTNRPRTACS